MSATRSKPDSRTEPDLDAEREVDLGRYLDALVARWWLPLLGLVVGVALGYLLAVGGKEVYQAQATVYVGTPYSPNASSTLQSIATNPNAVGRIARGQETIEEVSRESGMSPRELRAGVSTRPIRTGGPRTAPNQLYAVTVKGDRRGEVSAATAAIADRIVDEVGGYARLKRETFRRQLASDNRQLEAIERVVSQALADFESASPADRLTMATLLLTAEQRRGTLEQDRLQAQQLLAVAEQIELPRVVDRGSATKTTARSTRNSAAVAGLIGLIVGLLAALFWDPIAARTGRAT
jgi:Chain length determinant protein